MRISERQIEAIKQTTYSVFGNNAKAFLFGSRTDDTKRGGDIDLLISPLDEIDETDSFELKLKFLILLKKEIGDRKVDVVLDLQHNKGFVDEIKGKSLLL